MGDPQAPTAIFQAVLRHHQLLRPRGRPRLKQGVRLLSIGDHFDWGEPTPAVRERAAVDGEANLRFLCAHRASQTVVLVGNHDLARVGELFDVDDATFAAWQALADAHYYGHDGDSTDDSADRFFTACQRLPSTEMVARDLSTYRHRQQRLVVSLLRQRRVRLGHAENGLLFTHAGVTRKTIARLGLAGDASAADIALGLNVALDAAVDQCLRGRRQRPLEIPGLFRPADAIGEGDGMLFHRPLYLEDDQWLEPRRFDPRTLPRGLWQVVGHVRDTRCVSSLGPWSEPKVGVPGVIRHLLVEGSPEAPVVRYRHGAPPPRAEVGPDAAVMIFIDGAMNACAPDRYELLDVDGVAAMKASAHPQRTYRALL